MITEPIIRLQIGEGKELVFTSNEIMEAVLVEEINSVCIELPISTIEFKIKSYDPAFSMFSGTYFALLSQRLPMLIYERVTDDLANVTDYFMGKLYLDEWKNESETEYSFKGIDAIGVLESTPYDGGFWEVATPLSDIVSQILAFAEIDYEIDFGVQSVELKGWIPPSDCRKAIQQVCFAAGAIATSVRRSNLLIKPVPFITSPVEIAELEYVTQISDEQKGLEQTIELFPTVTSIELLSHDYSKGLIAENVFDEYLEIGTHKIVFNKPLYGITVSGPGYVASVLASEGGDYVVTENVDYIEVGGEYGFGVNSLILQLSEAGQVTITGYPWVDSKRAFLFTESVENYANRNALTIEDATMVNLANAQTALDNVRDYYRQRYSQNIKLFLSHVKPGDIVTSSTIHDRTLVTVVQKTSVNLAGGFITDANILGLDLTIIWTVRKPITGRAITGASLTRQSMFRS